MIVGIDLGTTNSAVAIWQDGAARLLPNALGELLTPSAVSVDASGQSWVGAAALDRMATHPEQTVTSFKRMMGTQASVTLGKRKFSAEELSAMVLAQLAADVEQATGERPASVVITVPAYFNERQRRATRRAGEIAGLDVKRLINEPTAAALAFGLQDQRDREPFLVFDLGGGTFDVSIVEKFEGIVEVRASAGDNRLGGEDFNDIVIQLIGKALERDLGDVRKGPSVLQERLREAAERARRHLTDGNEASARLIWNDREHAVTITAAEFEAACEPLLKRLRDPVLRSLRDSGIQSTSLEEVVLVGGATRMPLIRRAVTKMFGRFPSHAVDPDEAVARGAAVQAGLKARDAALTEVVLTDVCPYSMGVEITEQRPGGGLTHGVFSPILTRNSVVPISREQSYSPLDDLQAKVELRVYQGESRWVRDNVFLGTLEVPVPSGRATQTPVRVRFTYDINGLLEVNAEVEGTGLRRELLVYDADAIPPAELEKRRAALAALKVHPRETEVVRALLARAGRCIEAAIGDERRVLDAATSRFEAELDTQDPRAIREASAELEQVLDQFEGRSFL